MGRQLLMILGLTALWSPTFVWIKMALQGYSPVMITVGQVTLSTICFWGILGLSGQKLPRERAFWGHAVLMALLCSLLPFYFYCCAETAISSGTAALINGTTPLFTAIFAQLFRVGERLTGGKVLGLVMGVFGISLLYFPHWEEGAALAFIGAICYALSHVWAKRFLSGYHPLTVPTAQLSIAALALSPLLLLNAEQLVWQQGIEGIIALALLGTVCGYCLYFWALKRVEPTVLSLTTLLFPISSLFLGYLFLGETLSPSFLSAAGVILLAILLVTQPDSQEAHDALS